MGRLLQKDDEPVTTKEWLDDVVQSALCSRFTLNSTYNAASQLIVDGVPGDFVECGVWAGANSAAMARAIWDAGELQFTKVRPGGLVVEKPRVHLFDSFEGIPAAGPHDTGWTHEPGTSACSLETTQQQMKAWGIPDELLVYHPGWFETTVPLVALPWSGQDVIASIALLRLDADLYESTAICLKHLYPLVSPGGIVIVDDWALPGCRKALQDYGLPNGPISFVKES